MNLSRDVNLAPFLTLCLSSRSKIVKNLSDSLIFAPAMPLGLIIISLITYAYFF
jgi:hypothetical protein